MRIDELKFAFKYVTEKELLRFRDEREEELKEVNMEINKRMKKSKNGFSKFVFLLHTLFVIH